MPQPEKGQPRKSNAPGQEQKESSTGDPGRTPGKAEGDRDAVEESLRRQEE
jgi:hypothetical protein